MPHIAEMGRELCTHPKFQERHKLDLPGNGTHLFACWERQMFVASLHSYCSPHVGDSFLLTVCLGLRMTPGSGCEHTHSPRTTAEPTHIPGLSTNYMEKQRLICSLDPVTQHLCNGNLITCRFTFTRKWWCLWEEITFFLTGKANYLGRVCFIFHTPSSVGLTHAHLRAHYLSLTWGHYLCSHH